VEKADALVAEAISKLAEGFARTRGELDRQWKQGDQVSTEDLRVASSGTDRFLDGSSRSEHPLSRTFLLSWGRSMGP
jgi:hypothetical protein